MAAAATALATADRPKKADYYQEKGGGATVDKLLEHTPLIDLGYDLHSIES